MNAFFPRETQDIAYILLQTEGLGIGMTMAAACRDAKSCVSRATNTLTNHILLRTFIGIVRLGRRKMLRLYFGLTAGFGIDMAMARTFICAKPCVSRAAHGNETSEMMCWGGMHLLLVRRKILRLYFCRQCILLFNPSSFTQWRKPSRDAKSCVSRPFHSNIRML